jgi:hypothetical protein
MEVIAVELTGILERNCGRVCENAAERGRHGSARSGR